MSTLDALRDGSYVVVATTAGSRTEQLRQRFAAPNIVIEDFIDYDDLFPHVDVFGTNGGFGSVLAAMRHGVPVLAAGRSEGRNDVNARVGHNRLGVGLRTERPGPARIRSAVRRVLDDPTYAANAAKLRVELGSYDPMVRIEAALLGAVSWITTPLLEVEAAGVLSRKFAAGSGSQFPTQDTRPRRCGRCPCR